MALAGFLTKFSTFSSITTSRSFHTIISSVEKPIITLNSGISSGPGGLFNIITRSNIRCHFPRPSERKRIQRHGWRHRLSTPEGRRIIMNRILKGRWVLTH